MKNSLREIPSTPKFSPSSRLKFPPQSSLYNSKHKDRYQSCLAHHQAQRTCHCTPTRTHAFCSSTNLVPLCSVYVRNLEERIKVPELKEALTELFSEYGEIIDIVAKTNLKAKGQAFIVFDSVESAQKAIEEVQGFELFDKPMQLAFARTRSDASVKRTGDEDEFESHKRRRLAEKGISF